MRILLLSIVLGLLVIFPIKIEALDDPINITEASIGSDLFVITVVLPDGNTTVYNSTEQVYESWADESRYASSIALLAPESQEEIFHQVSRSCDDFLSNERISTLGANKAVDDYKTCAQNQIQVDFLTSVLADNLEEQKLVNEQLMGKLDKAEKDRNDSFMYSIISNLVIAVLVGFGVYSVTRWHDKKTLVKP